MMKKWYQMIVASRHGCRHGIDGGMHTRSQPAVVASLSGEGSNNVSRSGQDRHRSYLPAS